jgi:hypothetical protein
MRREAFRINLNTFGGKPERFQLGNHGFERTRFVSERAGLGNEIPCKAHNFWEEGFDAVDETVFAGIHSMSSFDGDLRSLNDHRE